MCAEHDMVSLIKPAANGHLFTSEDSTEDGAQSHVLLDASSDSAGDTRRDGTQVGWWKSRLPVLRSGDGGRQ